MAEKSNIQWTDATWNIARGCAKVDDDCRYCYMYRDSLNSTRYNPLQVTRTKTVFNLPLRLNEPSRIFTSSLTDFFHPDIDAYRADAWDIIRRCPQHTFQILTKRPERIAEHLPADWGHGWDNVWLGTSVGTQEAAAKRIPHLLRTPAKTRFLSCEPLTGEIRLNHLDAELAGDPEYIQIDCLTGRHTDMGRSYYDVPKIDWVIVGGESGNENGKYRYRTCKLEWIEGIVHQCWKSRVPAFVKQLGTHLSKELNLSDRHGGNMEEWPPELQIRLFPGKEQQHG
jgi:protein gp37